MFKAQKIGSDTDCQKKTSRSSRFFRMSPATAIAAAFIFAPTISEAYIPSKNTQTITPTAAEDTVARVSGDVAAGAKTNATPTTTKTESKPDADNKREKQNTIKKARGLCTFERLESQDQLDNYAIFTQILSRLKNYLEDGRLNEDDFSISISTDKRGNAKITVVLDKPISISLNQEFFGTWTYFPATGEFTNSAGSNGEEEQKDKKPQRENWKDKEEEQWPVDA